MSLSVHQGIQALTSALCKENLALLKKVAVQKGEVASFEFPLPIDYLGVKRVLRISFTEAFPNDKLKLNISPSPWLVWPHAEPDSLCLFGIGNPSPIGNPEEIVFQTIKKFEMLWDLVKQNSRAIDRKCEFLREISTYWDLQLPLNSWRQLFLLDHPLQSCELWVLTDPKCHQKKGKHKIWFSSTTDSIENYYLRVIGVPLRFRAPSNNAFHLALQTYPTVKIQKDNLLEWLRPHLIEQDFKHFQQWLHTTENEPLRWLFLSLPDKNPHKIQSIVLRNESLKLKQQIYHGARSGKKTPCVTKQRVTLERSHIHLLYPESVHSRDSNTQNNLKNKTVLMVGVGSLGSFTANLLIRSGVRKLIMIDPDTLSASNLGRHLLGADNLGESKVKALQELFQKDLPFPYVVAVHGYLQEEVRRNPSLLSNVDVVVNTTADWAAEYFLWEQKAKNSSWNLIQGWSEPYGEIGHALLAPSNGSADGRYLFEPNGRFKHRLSNWENNGIIALPACGEGFIPGGVVALNAIASMIAMVTIDSLIQANVKPLWCSLINDSKRIQQAGGEYCGSDFPENCSQLILSRAWPKNEGDCDE